MSHSSPVHFPEEGELKHSMTLFLFVVSYMPFINGGSFVCWFGHDAILLIVSFSRSSTTDSELTTLASSYLLRQRFFCVWIRGLQTGFASHN